MNWQQALQQCVAEGTAHVLATIIETSGSTPRKSGSKMLITNTAAYDTLGGGQLELLVIETARRMLTEDSEQTATRKYPLAAAAMQCCGGSVTVLYECFARPRLNVTVFGAGHIGGRICRLLNDLDAYTTVVDNRPEQLADLQANRIVQGEPLDACELIPSGETVLVMTHDHLLDYQIISALLGRTDLALLGLIGSTTKWQNFRKRLARDGFGAADLNRVTCPIGLHDIPGKLPMAIAIAVVAQLLQMQHAGQASAASGNVGAHDPR